MNTTPSNTTIRWLFGIALRSVVLVVTVCLLVQMFDRGGWWIAACLAWLPVNFAVVGYFGDDKKASRGNVFIPD
jgi:hypothetical protein